MRKAAFRKHIVVSFIMTAIAVAVIIGFGIFMFNRYPIPNEENTSMLSGMVTDVYSSKIGVMVIMSNGETLRLVYPWSSQELYSAIGYNTKQLADLLEGKVIEYRRTNQYPWILEIYIDDVKIDNNKLTVEQVIATRAGIVILELIMLAFPISGDAVYIMKTYKVYKRTKKKQTRKAKRQLKHDSKE